MGKITQLLLLISCTTILTSSHPFSLENSEKSSSSSSSSEESSSSSNSSEESNEQPVLHDLTSDSQPGQISPAKEVSPSFQERNIANGYTNAYQGEQPLRRQARDIDDQQPHLTVLASNPTSSSSTERSDRQPNPEAQINSAVKYNRHIRDTVGVQPVKNLDSDIHFASSTVGVTGGERISSTSSSTKRSSILPRIGRSIPNGAINHNREIRETVGEQPVKKLDSDIHYASSNVRVTGDEHTSSPSSSTKSSSILPRIGRSMPNSAVNHNREKRETVGEQPVKKLDSDIHYASSTVRVTGDEHTSSTSSSTKRSPILPRIGRSIPNSAVNHNRQIRETVGEQPVKKLDSDIHYASSTVRVTGNEHTSSTSSSTKRSSILPRIGRSIPNGDINHNRQIRETVGEQPVKKLDSDIHYASSTVRVTADEHTSSTSSSSKRSSILPRIGRSIPNGDINHNRQIRETVGEQPVKKLDSDKHYASSTVRVTADEHTSSTSSSTKSSSILSRIGRSIPVSSSNDNQNLKVTDSNNVRTSSDTTFITTSTERHSIFNLDTTPDETTESNTEIPEETVQSTDLNPSIISSTEEPGDVYGENLKKVTEPTRTIRDVNNQNSIPRVFASNPSAENSSTNPSISDKNLQNARTNRQARNTNNLPGENGNLNSSQYNQHKRDTTKKETNPSRSSDGFTPKPDDIPVNIQDSDLKTIRETSSEKGKATTEYDQVKIVKLKGSPPYPESQQ